MLCAMKRISDARKTAEEVLFDDRSRIVVMSDCHRGNGDGRFDNFLQNHNIYFAALNHYNREMFTEMSCGKIRGRVRLSGCIKRSMSCYQNFIMISVC